MDHRRMPVQCLKARRDAAGAEEGRGNAMSRLLRFVLPGLIVVVALVGAVSVLFGYFVYSPAPEDPRLSGTLTQGTIEVG
jgi:hypothetical protein